MYDRVQGEPPKRGARAHKHKALERFSEEKEHGMINPPGRWPSNFFPEEFQNFYGLSLSLCGLLVLVTVWEEVA